MGLLKILGQVLNWEESQQYFDKIRNFAVEIIINLMNESIKKEGVPRYGYEVIVILFTTRLNIIKFM
jgi:hypothetical protein